MHYYILCIEIYILVLLINKLLYLLYVFSNYNPIFQIRGITTLTYLMVMYSRVCLLFDNQLLRQPVQLSTMYAHMHYARIQKCMCCG